MKKLIIGFLMLVPMASQARPQTQIDCVNLRDPLYTLEVTLEEHGSLMIHVDYEGEPLASDGPVQVLFSASRESYMGERLQFVLIEDPSHNLSGHLTDLQGVVPEMFFACRKLR